MQMGVKGLWNWIVAEVSQRFIFDVLPSHFWRGFSTGHTLWSLGFKSPKSLYFLFVRRVLGNFKE